MKSELENILITSYKRDMISFLKSNPEYFEEAIQLAISDKQPFAWRSAFVLFDVMEENDKRILKHINKIVKCIPKKNDGHQRELLKILLKLNLPDKHEGKVFDICMNLWEDITKTPSIRMTAFKFIYKLAQRHKELLIEIIHLTQNQYLESLSPGIKNSIKKMIIDLDHNKR